MSPKSVCKETNHISRLSISLTIRLSTELEVSNVLGLSLQLHLNGKSEEEMEEVTVKYDSILTRYLDKIQTKSHQNFNYTNLKYSNNMYHLISICLKFNMFAYL